MTREQIEARLKALDQYQFALTSSMPDEGELTDRELMRVMEAKSKLRTMLANMNCTCPPDERPEPCERRYALRDCWRFAVLRETQDSIVELKSRDRNNAEQVFLDYLMRVKTALELNARDRERP